METSRSLLVHVLDSHERNPVDEEPATPGGVPSTTRATSSSLSNDDSTFSPNNSVVGDLGNSMFPRHSDFTVHTSNISMDALAGGHVPEKLSDAPAPDSRRTVLGGRVEQKYSRFYEMLHPVEDQSSSLGIPRRDSESTLPTENNAPETLGPLSDRVISDLTDPNVSPITSPLQKTNLIQVPPLMDMQAPKPSLRAHETIHAQSLLLGLAFLAIWSPQNMMAPNLTAMADEFHFETAAERDTYLGSNLALATGVLSLPIAGGIGILADVWNRKHLFVVTIAASGVFAALTGASRSYHWLFLARLLNGGCMSGSVPVAFSLLGDLFDTHERNAASSGLTAMMGMGIIAGQVYAGVVGSTLGWPHAFFVSFAVTWLIAILVLLLVQEPLRGGKEKVLQDMLERGAHYERKLTWEGFLHTMRHNSSNSILMWQGFSSSVPWGIMFVFLNDYLSQERGFSVPDATYLVFIFGIGAAVGGISGGYFGGLCHARNPSFLPLFMAATTFLGIFPFLLLLNGSFTDAHGFRAIGYSFLAGAIASLPSVSVRPCLINVNPPETRGAALTAANLVIQLARGLGPSFITLMTAIFGVNRRFSLNVALIGFWVVSAIQLVFLAKCLPRDQDAMEEELAKYAAAAMELADTSIAEEESIVSIEDRMTSFDAGAARESLKFMGDAIREIEQEIRTKKPSIMSCSNIEDGIEEEDGYEADLVYRRNIWIHQQQALRHDLGEEAGCRPGVQRQQTPSDFLLPDENTSLL